MQDVRQQDRILLLLQEVRHHHKTSLLHQLTEDRPTEDQVLLHTQTLLHTQEEAAVRAAREEALSTTVRAYREVLRPTTEVLQATVITAVHHPQRHVLQDTAEAVAEDTAEAVPVAAEVTEEAAEAAHPVEEDRKTIKTDIQ